MFCDYACTYVWNRWNRWDGCTFGVGRMLTKEICSVFVKSRRILWVYNTRMSREYLRITDLLASWTDDDVLKGRVSSACLNPEYSKVWNTTYLYFANLGQTSFMLFCELGHLTPPQTSISRQTDTQQHQTSHHNLRIFHFPSPPPTRPAHT